MLARAVETQRLREVDVAAERVVAWRGEQPVRPVALVEDQALHERLAIQPHAAVASLDGAQAEVALHAVGDLAVAVEQPRLQVVQPRRFGVPRDSAVELEPALAGTSRPRPHHLAVDQGGELDVPVGVDLEVDRAARQVRSQMQSANA